MSTAAKGPIESLIFVTAGLIDIMMREVELLKNMQPQEIRELQQRKSDLARAYEDCTNRIKADPGILAAADRPLKRQLRELTARFQAVLVENERALRAVKSVSERLLNVVVNAVAERQNSAAYSPTGAFGARALAGRAVSLSLNERL